MTTPVNAVHSELPELVEYFPDGQTVHDREAAEEYVPALQTVPTLTKQYSDTAVTESASCVIIKSFYCALHDVEEVAIVAVEYRPAMQAVPVYIVHSTNIGWRKGSYDTCIF